MFFNVLSLIAGRDIRVTKFVCGISRPSISSLLLYSSPQNPNIYAMANPLIFSPIPQLQTCQSFNITWSFLSVNSLGSLYIVNTTLTLTLPPPAGTAGSIAGIQICQIIRPLALNTTFPTNSFLWAPITVPQGTYQLMFILSSSLWSGSPLLYSSDYFSVVDSDNTTCVVPFSTSSTGPTSTTTGTGLAFEPSQSLSSSSE